MSEVKRKNKNTAVPQQSAIGKRSQGSAALILAVVIAIVLTLSYGVIQLMEQRAHSAAEKLVNEVVAHIDAKMNEVESVTREESKKAVPMLNDPDALEQLVRDFVGENSFVYGSTVAFEPDVFPERGRCFAPYSWKTPDGQVHSRQLGTETDYYEEEWYAETKLSGSEYWCEPYFDEGGAKVMMSTFSIPLYDGRGRLKAVMTADVGLDDLEEYVSTIAPVSDSYIVLRSAKGNPLANGEVDTSTGSDKIIIRGETGLGWSVELLLPFTYLMRGDTGILFIVGSIFLVAILFLYFVSRLLNRMQERSSAEYRNVIDALSSSFTSIYLVDLRTDETVVLRDPAGYAGVIGAAGEKYADFRSKLDMLIDYDCVPADREKMHREIEPETIIQSLEKQDRYEARFRKLEGGESRWHEMHVFALERDENGVPVRVAVAFSDVNDSVLKEKENQETLEQALTMAQSASKAKTDFLFNMSHDIRTPMNAIIGFTNMAKKDINNPQKALESLDKVQLSSDILLSLINDVLDMSRIESGKAELNEVRVDMRNSYDSIEPVMASLAASKDIDLKFSFGEIRDPYVYADPPRFNRIMINIISNAIKYTPGNGFVRVKTEQIESTEPGVANYRFTVADSGIGMSEEFQKKMFEEFSREENSTTSGVQGTGLGLALAKKLAEMMNGTISCESKQGIGTTFTIVFPFRLQTEEEIEETVRLLESEEADLNGKKVLLVEDNALNRDIAEDILSDEGLTVETAADGQQAVNTVRERGADYYDFILMDIQMPVMDGYEATRTIRRLVPDLRAPIIALSANAFDEDRKKSLESGMNDHVAKPIDVTVLKQALSKFM